MARDDDADPQPEDSVLALFQEPDGFYQPEREPSYAEHTLLSGQTLRIRLVGFNPLWGHHLWNAGRTLATHLEQHAPRLVHGRSVLELGAGAGLPSLVAAVTGAAKVVMTDYPDPDLVDNMRFNIGALARLRPPPCPVDAHAYLWGDPVEPLLAALGGAAAPGFDTLVLGDLLFNHSEHAKLVRTVRGSLSREPGSVALVFFTPYRPWLLERDLAFFDLARHAGLQVTKTVEKTMDKVMFEEDPGDETLRRTVFGYELTWPAA